MDPIAVSRLQVEPFSGQVRTDQKKIFYRDLCGPETVIEIRENVIKFAIGRFV